MRRRIYGPASINISASLEALATVRGLLNDTASAEPLLRDLIDITRAVRPATDATLLDRQLWLGGTLCATGKLAEGETTLRSVMAVVATRIASDSAPARARAKHARRLPVGGRSLRGRGAAVAGGRGGPARCGRRGPSPRDDAAVGEPVRAVGEASRGDGMAAATPVVALQSGRHRSAGAFV